MKIFALVAVASWLAACAPQPAAAPDVPAPVPAPPAPAPVTATSTKTARPPALIVSTREKPFAPVALSAEVARSATPDVSVDMSEPQQAMEGFGGAFNEHGWSALLALEPAERDAVMRAIFDPKEGLRFNLARTPVGASDYSTDRYTLNETRGDFAMSKFSIERDKKLLIPYIQAALKVRPDLKVWASAWTPPTWMKTNGAFDSGAMKDDPKVYGAYALYLAKFVESYRAEGIPIYMVVPQNEPAQLTRYPSCDWKPAQYVTFIRDHLGPTFTQRNLNTQIYVGTINRDDWDVFSVLADPGVAAVISGAAFQWGGLKYVADVKKQHPKLSIMQSETECGNNHWQPGFDPERPQNDFKYAAHTWRKFRDFIAAGASSYFLWNIVLDEHGKNIDSQRPWPQNSAVVIDKTTKKVIYTPMYFATRHFSGLVDRGARLLETSGANPNRIAFQNPDGSVVVELMNDAPAPTRVTVATGADTHVVELPAESFASLVIPAG